MERTLAEFGSLSAAEDRLRDEIGLGVDVVFGGEVPPEDAGADVTIRATFIRYLMLGGCDALPKPVPETGVQIGGARITGTLNLEGARCPRDLGLLYCRIEEAPILRSANLDGLFLNGSDLPGLVADRMQVRGGVFLRGATVTGEVRLLGAQIGGDLSCTGATLTAKGNALHADGVAITGAVFLRGATVTGEVRLLGVRIGRNLDCTGAKLTAGAGGDALHLDGATVGGALLLREGATVAGVLGLTNARIGSLCDEEACWPKAGDLLLDRCRYGAFTGTGTPVTAAARIRWLDLQDESRFGQEFWPQPWEQCAKVLREMGHGADARQVLIAKEERQRAARRARMGPVGRNWRRFWDWLMWLTTDYGRTPLKAGWALMAVWAVGVVIFAVAEQQGAIKPNNAFILRSPEWTACAPDYLPPRDGPKVRYTLKPYAHQLDCYRDQPEAASYPAFNAVTYSADTLLPIVAMEMQDYWLPDENAGPWGQVGRVYLWVQIIAGWALSLLAVAGFSGLIKTDNTT